jgi:cytochrome c oxidase assembly factor CtaG
VGNYLGIIFPLIVTHIMIRNYKSEKRLTYFHKLLILTIYIIILMVMSIAIQKIDIAKQTQYMPADIKELGIVNLNLIGGAVLLALGSITILVAFQKRTAIKESTNNSN